MRDELVSAVKSKIADDVYENDLKLSVAVDRLFETVYNKAGGGMMASCKRNRNYNLLNRRTRPVAPWTPASRSARSAAHL